MLPLIGLRTTRIAAGLCCLTVAAFAQDQTQNADPVGWFDLTAIPADALISMDHTGDGPTLGISVLAPDEETRLHRKLLLDGVAPLHFLAEPQTATAVRATALPAGPATATMSVTSPDQAIAGGPSPTEAVTFTDQILLSSDRGTQCVSTETFDAAQFGLSFSTYPGKSFNLTLHDTSGARILNQFARTQVDIAHIDTALVAACVNGAEGPVLLRVRPARTDLAPEPDITAARPAGIHLTRQTSRTTLLAPRDEDQFVVPAGTMDQPFDIHFEGSNSFTFCKGSPTRDDSCHPVITGVTGPFPADEDVILKLSRTDEWEQPITLSIAPTEVSGRIHAWALSPDLERDTLPAESFRVTGRLEAAQSRTIVFEAGETPQMWRFAISGGAIRQVTLSSVDSGLVDRRFRPQPDQRIVLQDLLLQPGQHQLVLSGSDRATFRVIGRPLGPAPQDDEREPNDGQPVLIAFGDPIRGRLPEGDRDNFQYFVRRPMMVEITSELPPGLDARMTSGFGNLASHPNLDRLRVKDTQSFRAPVQPGLHNLQLASFGLGSPEDYRVTVRIVNPFEDQLTGLPQTELPQPSVAAHLLYGQRVALDGIPAEAASVQIWSAHPGVSLDESASTPVLAIAPDMPVGTFRGFVLFENAQGSVIGGAEFDLHSDLFVPPSNPVPAPRLPEILQGAVNVAQTSFGARLVAADDYTLDPETGDIAAGHPSRATAILSALDGVVAQSQPPVSQRAVLARGGQGDAVISPVIALPGDGPIPLVGFGVSAIDRVEGGLRGFAVDVSQDGENWTEVVSDTYANRDWQTVYPLPRAFPARFVRLRPLPDQQTKVTGVWLNSFEIYAASDWSLPDINLADPRNGALAHRDFDGSAFADFGFMLTPSDDADRLQRPDPLAKIAPVNVTWTLNRTRTARLDRLELDMPTEPSYPLPTQIVIEASLTDQRGPWRDIATLPLQDGQTNVVAQFETPQEVRLLRMKLGFPEGEDSITVPLNMRAYEATASEDQPSILGLPAEWDVPGIVRDPPVTATPDRGQLSPDGAALTGTVNLGERTESWTLSGAAGANTAEITVTGGPGFVPRLVASMPDGTVRSPRAVRIDEATSALVYSFDLAPEETLTLRVSEPQRSTVFLIDTSPSVAPFVPQIRSAIRRFADTMVAGEDAVQFGVIGREDFDTAWITDPLTLQTRLAASLPAGNSNAEGALVAAAETLQSREGSRAIVLVSDADSNMTEGTLQSLATAQARVFTIKMSSGGMWQNPRVSQPLSMAWSGMTGGEVWPVIAPQIDIAAGYARATARLLDPKNYKIAATMLQIDIAPGALLVEAVPQSDTEAATGRVLHILLDTSGSMLARQDDGTRRITLAKRALQDLIAAPDVADSFGLRVFGGPPEQCLTTLIEAPQSFEMDRFSASIDSVAPQNLAKTPIAAALRAAGEDLAEIADRAALVLITDGEETCEGDPLAEIAALRDAGIETRIDVVSFALAAEVDRGAFEAWATAGGGTYFDVSDGGALADVLQAVAQPSVAVWKDGVEMTRMMIGETLTDLPPGEYELRFDDGQTSRIDVAPQMLTVLGADGTRIEDM